jgi:PKD-like domain/Secretion system C-terminal sorting domain
MKQLLHKLFPFLFGKKPVYALVRAKRKMTFILLFLSLFAAQAAYSQSAGVNIAVTSGTIPSCIGSTVTFTATPTNGGTAPTYNWYVNNLAAGNGSVLTTTTSNPMTVICQMTSNLPGVTNNPALSNTVIMHQFVTITPSKLSMCLGQSITFTATSNYTNAGPTADSYQWKLNGVNVGTNSATFTTTNLNGTYGGNYNDVKCTVTSSNPCVSAATGTCQRVQVDYLDQYASSILWPGSIICPTTGYVNLTASGTYDPNWTQYQWYNGQNLIAGATFNSYNATTAGTYTYILSNQCGSKTSQPVTITTGTQPLASITSALTIICPGSSESLSANTGTGLSYQWNLNTTAISGATSSSYYATTAGSYTCVVTNSCGSVTSNAITMAVGSVLPPATIVSSFTAFCPATTIQLFATSGNAGLTYQWNLNNIAIIGATSGIYNATSAGNYTCLVTNSCGSKVSNTITLTVNPLPPASITSATTSICSGSSVLLSANRDVTYSYQWKLNGANISGATSYTYVALAAGSYTCAVTNSCGTSISNTIVITVINGVSAAGAINGLSSFCAWLPMQYGVASIAGATTYNWSVPAGASISSGQGTNQITVALPNTVSSGTISVYGSNGTCSGTPSSLPITVLSTPNIPTSTDAVGCSGSPITLSGIPSGGTWSVPNPYTGPSTSFYYTVTNSNTCSASSLLNNGLPNTITVNPLPTVTAANVSGCAGTAIALSGTPAVGTWSVANPYTGPSTTYTHSYTDANGCSNTSPVATIAVTPLPDASITSSSTTVCSGSSITISANTGTGLTYQWKLNSTAISGATASTYAATTAGSYNCDVSNSCGVVSSNAIAIAAGSLPTATITASGSTSFCQGGSVTLTANTASGYTYQWKLNGSAISGANSSTYVATVSGNFKCTITNVCGTTTSNIIAVTVLSPVASITASGSTTFCGGGSVVLSAVVAAGQTYVWKKDGTTISGATASTYTASSTGNYKCVVTSSCGTSTSNVIAVIAGVPAKPGKITGATSVCANSTQTYSIAPISTATSYVWTVPTGATVTAGQSTTAITVLYGTSAGKVGCSAVNVCGTGAAKLISISMTCRLQGPGEEEEGAPETKINVYPNPSQDGIFTVDFENSDVNYMQVFDILGKEIFSNKEVNPMNEYTLNLAQFPKGVYVLKLQGTETNKVIRIQK